MLSQKKLNNYYSGFTLIELLVSIIIVGVLSTIALPSFLNQVGKARSSEARSSIGLINRAQQAYRYENSRMATSLATLGINNNSEFYTYAIVNIDTDNAGVTTTTKIPDLRLYSSRVQQSGDRTTHIICESDQISASGITSQPPIDISNCAAGYSKLR